MTDSAKRLKELEDNQRAINKDLKRLNKELDIEKAAMEKRKEGLK